MSASRGAYDDLSFAAVLATLPRMTPKRLATMLRGRSATEVFEEVVKGSATVIDALSAMHLVQDSDRDPDSDGEPAIRGNSLNNRRALATELAAIWSRRSAVVDVEQLWSSLESSGIAVLRYGESGYPRRLCNGHEPAAPEVLFCRGDTEVLDGPCVAMVGTRRATHYGQEVAAEMARDLSSAGVCIVSGLALGIDASAHEGALAGIDRPRPESRGAGPAGVLGGGVDVVYPPRNRHLIERVAKAGCLLSEAPPGARPDPWRFPQRNRIMAGLAHCLVVVESPRSGGAMYTAEAALRRDCDVLAVPGSVRSKASDGPNDLISSGALVARDSSDILVALESRCAAEGTRLRSGGRSTALLSAKRSSRAEREARNRHLLTGCSQIECAVYEALDDHSATVDMICQRSGAPLAVVALTLEHLLELGLATEASGSWVRV